MPELRPDVAADRIGNADCYLGDACTTDSDRTEIAAHEQYPIDHAGDLLFTIVSKATRTGLVEALHYLVLSKLGPPGRWLPNTANLALKKVDVAGSQSGATH